MSDTTANESDLWDAWQEHERAKQAEPVMFVAAHYADLLKMYGTVTAYATAAHLTEQDVIATPLYTAPPARQADPWSLRMAKLEADSKVEPWPTVGAAPPAVQAVMDALAKIDAKEGT